MNDYELRRNASKYYDPTAYKAIKNYIKSKEKAMEYYPGDIFKGELNNGSDREFVILSVHGNFSTVLMLSDNDALPYPVKSNDVRYTNPGMLQYMFNDKFTTYIRSMKKAEIDDLLKEVVDGLGYDTTPIKVETIKNPEPVKPTIDKASVDSMELTKVQAERDVYKSLYENLLGSMIGKG